MKIFYLLYFLFLPILSHAYLDPGTGSLLVYALIGMISSLIFSLRNVWYWILEKIFSRNIEQTEKISNLVIYAEGKQYWQVFEPIVSAWTFKGNDCTYITADSSDPVYEYIKNNHLVNVIATGKEMMTMAFLNQIKAKIVLSTTPNLDIYMWRRSKKVDRYIYLFHAPATVEFLERYALSFYDDIFIIGEFQKKGINGLDKLRGLPEKRLYKVGLPYYDFLLKQAELCERTEKKFTILYAPSWGKRSSLAVYGTAILDELVKNEYNIIFRPHPQSKISDKNIIDDINKRYGNSTFVTIDTNSHGLLAMQNSDILITDLSGILFDYVFLFNKPVILAATEAPLEGYEAEDIKEELHEKIWNVESAKALSYELGNNLKNISALIAQIKIESEINKEKIDLFKETNIANFGTAGKAAADQLELIMGEII